MEIERAAKMIDEIDMTEYSNTVINIESSEIDKEVRRKMLGVLGVLKREPEACEIESIYKKMLRDSFRSELEWFFKKIGIDKGPSWLRQFIHDVLLYEAKGEKCPEVHMDNLYVMLKQEYYRDEESTCDE